MGDPFDKYDALHSNFDKGDVWGEKTKTCNVCNNAVKKGAKFCPHCGSTIKYNQEELKQMTQVKFCVKCGCELYADAVICHRCGVSVPRSPNLNKSPASIALYLTIGSLFFMPMISIVPALIAIVLGIKEKNKAAISVGSIISLMFAVIVLSIIYFFVYG